METGKDIQLKRQPRLLRGHQHPSKEFIEEALQRGTEELRSAIEGACRKVGYPSGDQMQRPYNI